MARGKQDTVGEAMLDKFFGMICFLVLTAMGILMLSGMEHE
jgi:hypothetical protein